MNDPDILKARSLAKYEFIRDAVMLSNSYVSVIRPDLTFTVLNLFPNYNYPGKIRRISTEVIGAPTEDKTLKVEIEISPLPVDTSPAIYIRARIMSPISPESPVAAYFDMYFSPINAEHTVFQGTLVLRRFVRKGYWRMPNISILDAAGRERYESSLLYGFQCYLDNPLEDIIPPRVQRGTPSLTLTNGTISGHPVQIVTAKFTVIENTGIEYYFAALVPPSGAYSMQRYGLANTDGGGERSIDFYLKEYSRSGHYTLNQIMLKDYGMYLNYTYFNTSGSSGNSDGTTDVIDDPAPYLDIHTLNPDSVGPELDVNRLTVIAVPTNPTTPDGETLVTITYSVRDDISGYGEGSNFKLRDPQGIEHFYWFYHRNTYTEFFGGEPTAWEQYTQQVILPRGSVPGIWGLSQMTLGDKAGNLKAYDITETVRFDPNSTAASDLGIIGDPVATSYITGGTIDLAIHAAGGDRVSYEWFKDGVSLLTSGIEAMTDHLQILNAIAADAGTYYCVVSNASGRVVSKAVEVIFRGNGVGPGITAGPSSQTATVGGNASFTVELSGDRPPTCQWQLSADGGGSWTNLADTDGCSGVTTAALIVAGVTIAMNGYQYRCVAENSLGTVYSDAAILEVSKAAATVILSGVVVVYDGTAKTPTALTVPRDLVVTLAYDGSAAAPTNAGSYTVIGTVTDSNYAGSATNTLLISQASAVVNLAGMTQTYNGMGRSVVASTEPANLVVNMTYNGLSITPTNVGSYTVIATINDQNYQGSVTNTLLISFTLSSARSPDGTYHFSFIGTPGASFTVLAAPNPASSWSDWTVVGGATESSHGQFEFTDSGATNNGPRFYRVSCP